MVTVVDRYLRAVRSLIDTLGVSLADALEMARIPLEMREPVRIQTRKRRRFPSGARTCSPGQADLAVGSSCGIHPQAITGSGSASTSLTGWGGHKRTWARWTTQTDRILSHIEDPRPTGPAEFDVRGLVMGYVPSGKTANFCALPAKAADAGYKLVIILSGIHNSLRLQTQRRIDRTLGIDATGVPRAPSPGVDGSHSHSVRCTATSVLALSTRTSYRATSTSCSSARRTPRSSDGLTVGWRPTPASLPVLIIDDEADQACS